MDINTIAASVAGAVGSKVAFHPIDTIRTLQQTSTNLSYILPWKAYWRGLPAALALTTPAFTTYMVSYRQTKQSLHPYLGDGISNYFVSGAVAEITSSVIWTPMEVCKGRSQISESRGLITLMKDIYKKEGVPGFFRGYWMGIAVFLPHTVMWWISYEETKKLFDQKNKNKNKQLSSLEYGASSAVATIAASTGSNFLDIVKTRQQLAVADEIAKLRPDDQKSVLKVARNLIQEVGLFRALFKGLHVRLLHALPSSILAMVIVEKMQPDLYINIE